MYEHLVKKIIFPAIHEGRKLRVISQERSESEDTPTTTPREPEFPEKEELLEHLWVEYYLLTSRWYLASRSRSAADEQQSGSSPPTPQDAVEAAFPDLWARAPSGGSSGSSFVGRLRRTACCARTLPRRELVCCPSGR